MQDTITKIEDLLEDLEEMREESVNIINPAQLEDIIYELSDIKDRIESSLDEE